MRRWYFILLSVALTAGCGTAVQAPREDPEVNVGYGTARKSELSQPVSSVKINDNERTYRDIYEYLEGRVAGVMVTTDKRIIVRGVGTVNGTTDPLIMVDGTEMQDISALNPNDIKSVDVLKGSSASIYGMRGANGVILITTKR